MGWHWFLSQHVFGLFLVLLWFAHSTVGFKSIAVYAIHIISYFHFSKKKMCLSQNIFLCYWVLLNLFYFEKISYHQDLEAQSVRYNVLNAKWALRQTKTTVKSKLIYVNQHICLTNSNITINLSYEAIQTKSANIAQFSIRSHFTKNQ